MSDDNNSNGCLEVILLVIAIALMVTCESVQKIANRYSQQTEQHP